MSDISLQPNIDFCKYKLFSKLNREMAPQCACCENWYKCASELGIPAKRYERVNCVSNTTPNGDSEIIYYKNSFLVLREQCNQNPDSVKRDRLFDIKNKITLGGKTVDNVLVSKDSKKTVTFQKFQESMFRSAKRAKDNFYNYGLSNEWDYFVTLTFSSDMVDRNDDEAVKNLWSNWLYSVKKENPDIKVLLVPEMHKKGSLHFHGFMADCPKLVLSQAYYPETYKFVDKRGTPILTRLGDPVFNLVSWKYGFTTVAILPKEHNSRRVVNYCVKYMSKSGDVGYNKKRFYRTRNLKCREKVCVDWDSISNVEFLDFFKSMGYEKCFFWLF